MRIKDIAMEASIILKDLVMVTEPDLGRVLIRTARWRDDEYEIGLRRLAAKLPVTIQLYVSWGEVAGQHTSAGDLLIPLYDKEDFSPVRCECGSEKAGSIGHSHWCPKFVP